MSEHVSLFPLAATGATAFALVAALLLAPDFARAAEVAPATPGCGCPDNAAKSRKPKFAAYTSLDETDELAALESLQFALTEVGDGSTYVWRRSHGRLSGLVKPTRSFKNAGGAVCREAVVILNGVDDTKKTQTIACRMENGVWRLEG